MSNKKTCNWFCNIAAKQVVQRCCAFYHPRKKPCNPICCKTGSNLFCTNVSKQVARFSLLSVLLQHSQQRKKTLHVQRTFFVHFFAVVLHDCNVKLPSYTFCGGNVVCVPIRFFLFSCFFAAHFHLGGRQHFSFSHRHYKNFCFFLQRNLSPCVLSLALALFLLSTSVEIQSKKRLGFNSCQFIFIWVAYITDRLL